MRGRPNFSRPVCYSRKEYTLMLVFKNLNIQKPKLIVNSHDVRNKENTFYFGVSKIFIKNVNFH